MEKEERRVEKRGEKEKKNADANFLKELQG